LRVPFTAVLAAIVALSSTSARADSLPESENDVGPAQPATPEPPTTEPPPPETASPESAPAVAADEAVVVLGVEPHARLYIFEGETDADGMRWRKTATTETAWAYAHEDSFVVLRLKPRTGRQSYAVTKVFVEHVFGAAYEWQPSSSAWTFAAPAGEVTFVGGLRIVKIGPRRVLMDDPLVTRERAADFLAAKHPELAGRLGVAPLRLAESPSEASHTPRQGVLTSWSLGVAGGPMALKSAAGAFARSGSGVAIAFMLGVALWDHVPINVTIGGGNLGDHQPFTEFVVDCTSYGGTTLSCGGPHAEKSVVRTGELLGLETGYQHRFRPWPWWSLLPAVLVGHAWMLKEFSRGVECGGCVDVPITGVDTSGVYVAPAFKLTFVNIAAITARTEIFLTGDMAYRTLFGVEFGLP
jgi:hypothetical protein